MRKFTGSCFSGKSVCLQVYSQSVPAVKSSSVDVRRELIVLYTWCGVDSITAIYFLRNLSLLFCAYWRGHVVAFVGLLAKVGDRSGAHRLNHSLPQTRLIQSDHYILASLLYFHFFGLCVSRVRSFIRAVRSCYHDERTAARHATFLAG